MEKSIRAITAGILAMSLAGCVINVSDEGASWGEDWRDRQEHNRQVISRLEIGQTRFEVEDRLGEPDFTEAYTHDGADYHILHYRTQHRHSDGETTPDETTPLVFRNGHLEGWGDTIYSRVTAGSHE